MTIGKYYGVLIATDPHTGFGAKVGWDACHTDRVAAEQLASRAETLFHGAKVVEMTREEAVENGWLDCPPEIQRRAVPGR